ncbi:radical SAM family heme chaperone HemW [Myroides odoratimimus]|uniref:Heme chaperone HemW n=1 Tax=Myroides odoratimimus TaxID=76832 RepID=A0AAI8G465_9FLAO|nr:radical SAM family heme chaperone HemW [Myroides odoratimimus]ALU25937.1 coproporphyrinogen III oxidase [Myroides odoratimimus]EHO14428.1 putative oxygen-independent coproporphyrinogen III oxidase [Myroides odoratimimus CCUG 12901]MDM1033120.1 radical SAM family heme chaperone HemW [Myroides odoratimimus]MDM1038740.1 radical SAM family heme chaperone HemW [Myroides odoratimimus]MDM1052818.1 radical SAM family heme chaperone HemW [Myroides odoratimimus]
MAGIYIHIPFCKQACHYCDFHFSTSLKKKEEMLAGLKHEMALRQNELDGGIIETIYFGGGTPSILEVDEINDLIQTIYNLFEVNENPEITLEANPDDLDKATLYKLAESRVNRLSIGIQSFYEDDLKMMNRAHNSTEAIECLEIATSLFDNISIDLIYGIPNMSNERWLSNVQRILDLGIPHISCYALTVEERTALNKLIKKGVIPSPEEEVAHQHFMLLIETLKANGYIHYELSNFAKPGYYSKNNSAYWLGKKYLGIGPSAHSFDGVHRSWNIANNTLYIKDIAEDKLPREIEELNLTDRYNEYIMTGLRTIWGVDLTRVEREFGKTYHDYLVKFSTSFLEEELMHKEGDILTITNKGKFLSDGIASDLFYLDLK